MGRVWGLIALLMCFYRANASSGKTVMLAMLLVTLSETYREHDVKVITRIVNVLAITGINTGMSKWAFSVYRQML